MIGEQEGSSAGQRARKGSEDSEQEAETERKLSTMRKAPELSQSAAIAVSDRRIKAVVLSPQKKGNLLEPAAWRKEQWLDVLTGCMPHGGLSTTGQAAMRR